MDYNNQTNLTEKQEQQTADSWLLADEHSPQKIAELIEEWEKAMREAARKLEFERAAELRDKVRALRERLYISGQA